MDTKYLEIIKAPVITEKSGIRAQEGKYVFKVDSRSNKTGIDRDSGWRRKSEGNRRFHSLLIVFHKI